MSALRDRSRGTTHARKSIAARAYQGGRAGRHGAELGNVRLVEPDIVQDARITALDDGLGQNRAIDATCGCARDGVDDHAQVVAGNALEFVEEFGIDDRVVIEVTCRAVDPRPAGPQQMPQFGRNPVHVDGQRDPAVQHQPDAQLLHGGSFRLAPRVRAVPYGMPTVRTREGR